MMFDHEDKLMKIDQNLSLGKKLESIHSALKERFPFIDRVAAAIYDAKTDTLKTFLHSSGADRPLANYQAKVSEAKSLKEILDKGRPRVVNDLGIFNAGTHRHTRRIAEQGYQSSYTMPMYDQGSFFGFLFFNSYQRNAFTEEVLPQIDPFGHLIALTIIHDVAAIQTLLATVKTARDMAHARDHETGSHLDRMSRYARAIARRLAHKYDFSDEHIENIFVFSPLHDIGKIAIPDEILLKPGALDESEREVMKTHTVKGRELIDRMLTNFNLGNMQHIEILRNIAEFHHEAIDGSGYPAGRQADEIPIESRIVAVADIFDALTSRRPYKPAWTNEEAFETLQALSGIKLDADCVEALVQSCKEIEEIQQHFQENSIG